MSNARKVRFGWNLDGTPNDQQQRIIDQIADLWFERHQSATRVADELNADGVPTARGGLWRDTSVRKILADNPERVAAAKDRAESKPTAAPGEMRPLPAWDDSEDYNPKTGEMYTVCAPAPREPRPEEAAFRAAREESIRRHGQRLIGYPKDVRDLAARERWLSGKTKRVPGKRLPDGSYPRGYWPMPAWCFFEHAEQVARLPCECTGVTFSNGSPRVLYVLPAPIEERRQLHERLQQGRLYVPPAPIDDTPRQGLYVPTAPIDDTPQPRRPRPSRDELKAAVRSDNKKMS
jgi:hypothetical protein